MSEDKKSIRPPDSWASGKAYEPYVGRWSRLVAREFLKWLGLPAGRRWLDVGCGTGALSEAILQIAAPSRLTGIDQSTEFIRFARERIQDASVQFEVGHAEALPIESGTCDVAVSGLVLNFVARPDRALAEMSRATQSGGLVGVYVWDYAGDMQLMRHFWNAATALDAAAAELDEGRRFPLCRPGPLRQLFQAGGLISVEVRPIDIVTEFQDFEDYWSPFLGGQGPAPTYVMSLSEERREALRERIRSGLPHASNGSIPLMARAWAVRGIR